MGRSAAPDTAPTARRPAGESDSGKKGTIRARQVPHTAFIVGVPRSGTTLLGYMLAGGNDVLCLSEPFFIRSSHPGWLFRSSMRRMQRAAKMDCVAVPKRCDEEDFLRYLRELARRKGSAFLVIKETFRIGPAWGNVEFLTRLAAGPDRVVGIIRDPYDTAVSTLRFWRFWPGALGRIVEGTMRRLIGMQASVPPRFADARELVHYVAMNWRSFVDWCSCHDVFTIRYEQLVSDPYVRLSEVCRHCGVPFSKEMLDHRRPRCSFGGVGDPGVMNRPPRAVDVESMGRRDELAPEFRQIIAEECSSAAAKLGYQL